MVSNDKKKTLEQYQNLNNINHSNSRERKRQTSSQELINIKQKKSKKKKKSSTSNERIRSAQGGSKNGVLESQPSQFVYLQNLADNSNSNSQSFLSNANQFGNIAIPSQSRTNQRGQQQAQVRSQTAHTRPNAFEAGKEANMVEQNTDQELANSQSLSMPNNGLASNQAPQQSILKKERARSSNAIRKKDEGQHRKNRSLVDLQQNQIGEAAIFEDDIVALKSQGYDESNAPQATRSRALSGGPSRHKDESLGAASGQPPQILPSKPKSENQSRWQQEDRKSKKKTKSKKSKSSKKSSQKAAKSFGKKQRIKSYFGPDDYDIGNSGQINPDPQQQSHQFEMGAQNIENEQPVSQDQQHLKRQHTEITYISAPNQESNEPSQKPRTSAGSQGNNQSIRSGVGVHPASPPRQVQFSNEGMRLLQRNGTAKNSDGSINIQITDALAISPAPSRQRRSTKSPTRKKSPYEITREQRQLLYSSSSQRSIRQRRQQMNRVKSGKSLNFPVVSFAAQERVYSSMQAHIADLEKRASGGDDINTKESDLIRAEISELRKDVLELKRGRRHSCDQACAAGQSLESPAKEAQSPAKEQQEQPTPPCPKHNISRQRNAPKNARQNVNSASSQKCAKHTRTQSAQSKKAKPGRKKSAKKGKMRSKKESRKESSIESCICPHEEPVNIDIEPQFADTQHRAPAQKDNDLKSGRQSCAACFESQVDKITTSDKQTCPHVEGMENRSPDINVSGAGSERRSRGLPHSQAEEDKEEKIMRSKMTLSSVQWHESEGDGEQTAPPIGSQPSPSKSIDNNEIQKDPSPGHRVPEGIYPQLRTVFRDFQEADLLEFINAAQDYRQRYDPVEFPDQKERRTGRRLTSGPFTEKLFHQDMVIEEKFLKEQQIEEMNKEQIDQIETQFKYGKNIGNPFEIIHAPTKLHISSDPFHREFIDVYRTKNLRNFVHLANFREDSKQWRMAYDPYVSEKMLAIYGKNPPPSFKIRQKILQEQKNILDRYSHVSPINDKDCVLNEKKRHYNKSRRDYLAEKHYQRYVADQNDLQFIIGNLKQSNVLRPPRPQFTGEYEIYSSETLMSIYEEFYNTSTASRDQVQNQIESRLQDIKACAMKWELFDESTLHKSMDQTDYEERQKVNQQVLEAAEYDNQKVINDEIYRAKFKNRLGAMLVQGRSVMQSIDSILFEKLPDLPHSALFEAVYQHNLSPAALLRTGHPRYAKRLSKQQKIVMDIEYIAQQDQNNKEYDWEQKKLRYYKDHNDFDKLQKFIYQPFTQNGSHILIPGLSDKFQSTSRWLLNKHYYKPQFTQQQFIQKKFKYMERLQRAMNQLEFVDVNFLETDQDLQIGGKNAGQELDRPQSIERLFNNVVFRSKLSCLNSVYQHKEFYPAMEVFEVAFDFKNNFQDWQIMHKALQEAIIKRLHKQYSQLERYYNQRQPIREKKITKYRRTWRQAYEQYAGEQRARVTRKRSHDHIPVPTYERKVTSMSYESANQQSQGDVAKLASIQAVKEDVWRARIQTFVPFTEEFIPARAKRRYFLKTFSAFAFEEPFVKPIRPYMEHVKVDYIVKLMNDYKEFFQQEDQNLVKDFDDGTEIRYTNVFEEWIESSFNSPLDRKQLQHGGKRRSEVIHFQPPDRSFEKDPYQASNIPALGTDESQRMQMDRSSDPETSEIDKYDPQASQLLEQELGSTQKIELGQQNQTDDQGHEDRMAVYFQNELRKEMRDAIEQLDYNTLNNYVESLQGTLRPILNQRDSRHLGNTLIHFAVQLMDRIGGFRQTVHDSADSNEDEAIIDSRKDPPQKPKYNRSQQKDQLYEIIHLLISDKAGGDVTVTNEVGKTAFDYASHLRNDNDRQEMTEVLEAAKRRKEDRERREAAAITRAIRDTTKKSKKRAPRGQDEQE